MHNTRKRDFFSPHNKEGIELNPFCDSTLSQILILLGAVLTGAFYLTEEKNKKNL